MRIVFFAKLIVEIMFGSASVTFSDILFHTICPSFNRPNVDYLISSIGFISFIGFIGFAFENQVTKNKLFTECYKINRCYSKYSFN